MLRLARTGGQRGPFKILASNDCSIDLNGVEDLDEVSVSTGVAGLIVERRRWLQSAL